MRDVEGSDTTLFSFLLFIFFNVHFFFFFIAWDVHGDCDGVGDVEGSADTHTQLLRCQYLYFCTSKASTDVV